MKGPRWRVYPELRKRLCGLGPQIRTLLLIHRARGESDSISVEKVFSEIVGGEQIKVFYTVIYQLIFEFNIRKKCRV
jgi:hypothetical protein